MAGYAQDSNFEAERIRPRFGAGYAQRRAGYAQVGAGYAQGRAGYAQVSVCGQWPDTLRP